MKVVLMYRQNSVWDSGQLVYLILQTCQVIPVGS